MNGRTVAGHPEHERDDHRGADEHGHARRQGAMRRRPVSSISTNGAAAGTRTSALPRLLRRIPARSGIGHGAGGVASVAGSAGSGVGSRGSPRGDGSLRAGSSIVPQTTRRGRPARPPPIRAPPALASRRAPFRKPLADPTRDHRSLGGGHRRKRPPGRIHGCRPAASPRVVRAPLPLGIAAEAELIDVVLVERLPTWRVREALIGQLPDGWSLVDLYDVWPAGPPLAGRVVAADYRIVAEGSARGESVEDAARRMRASATLPRDRSRGAETVRYDLRPLIVDLVVEAGLRSSSARGRGSIPSSVPDGPMRCSPRSPKHRVAL